MNNESINTVYFSILIITLLGVGIIGIVIEYLYRIYKFRTSFRTIFQKSDIPGLLYELKPNIKKYYKGEDYEKKILYEINKFGLRNPDFNLEEKNVKKILILGDSITFGFGVEESETFSRQLENRLKSAKIRSRVINGGTGTYNIIQDYYFLKYKGLLFKPNIVILSLNLSNLIKDSDWTFDNKKGYVKTKYPKKSVFISNTRGLLHGKFSMIGKYLDKIYLFRFLIKPNLEKKLFNEKSDKKIGNVDQIKKYIDIFRDKNGNELKRRLKYISKINNDCKLRSAKLLVLMCPFSAQLENSFKNIELPQKTIIAYCKRNKIDSFSVLDLFRNNRSKHTARHYFFDEVHFTVQGHKLVAKGLTEISQHILKSS